MSELVKQETKYAKQYAEDVFKSAEHYQKVIPDKQLGEKLRKMGESAKEVVKHIEERSGKNG